MAINVADPRSKQELSGEDWKMSNTTATLPIGAMLTGSPPGSQEFRFPFDGGELVVEVPGNSPAWVEQTFRSLGALLRLGPGWDSYGSSPIDPHCVVAAIEMAFTILRDDSPIPSVVPTSRGGLQLEWHRGGVDLEIEFLSATRVFGYFADQFTDTVWEKDLAFDLQPLADAISTLSQRC